MFLVVSTDLERHANGQYWARCVITKLDGTHLSDYTIKPTEREARAWIATFIATAEETTGGVS